MQADRQALTSSEVQTALLQQLKQLGVANLELTITGEEICVAGVVSTFHAKQLVTSITRRLYPGSYVRNQLTVDRTGTARV